MYRSNICKLGEENLVIKKLCVLHSFCGRNASDDEFLL